MHGLQLNSERAANSHLALSLNACCRASPPSLACCQHTVGHVALLPECNSKYQPLAPIGHVCEADQASMQVDAASSNNGW